MEKVLCLRREILFADEYPWKTPLGRIPTSANTWEEYLGPFQHPCLENARVEFTKACKEDGLKFTQVKGLFISPPDDLLSTKQDVQFVVGRDDVMAGDLILVSKGDLTNVANPFLYCGWGVVRSTKIDKFNGRSGIVAACTVWNVAFQADDQECWISQVGTQIPTERVMKSLSSIIMHEGMAKDLEETVLHGTTTGGDNITVDLEQHYKQVDGLNPSQSKAVNTVLHTHRSGGGVVLIQGPPGTGKTSTTSALIIKLLDMFPDRILCCAPTNIAMIEVAKKLIKTKSFEHLDMLVFCNEEKASAHLDESLVHFTLPFRMKKVSKAILDFVEDICSINEKRLANNGEIVLNPAESMCNAAKLYDSSLIEICGGLVTDLEIFPIFKMAASMSQLLQKEDVFLVPNLTRNLRDLQSRVTSVIEFDAVNCPNKTCKFCNSLEVDEKRMCKNRKEWMTTEKRESREFFRKLRVFFLDHARVCFSTINGSMSSALIDWKYEIAIVDEAAQALEAETTCILRNGLNTLVLVGDHKQLEGVVFSEVAAAVGYKKSMFGRLVAHHFPVQLLNIQYRMHPQISAFSSQQFYNGQILDSELVIERSAKFPPTTNLPILQTVCHSSTKVEKDKTGSSWNPKECEMICLRLHELQVHVGNNVNVSVGIICPYKAQKAYLTKMVATLPSKSGMNVVVNTVDGFQGQEKDVIIVSLTSVGHASHFVRDPKRVNVALTRAKFALWVFGDDGAIRSAFPHWSAFVAYSEGRLGVSTKFAVSAEPKQIAYVQSLEKHMATEAAEYESISKILGSTEEWHIWSVVATDTLYTDCKKLNIPAPALICVLSELKMGRFRSSTRPYRREGILGELFYVRKIGDNCVVWTVEVRQKSHVIHLLSIVKTPQLSAMWTKFRDAMGQVDIEFAEACNGFTQSGDGVCIPNENFDNPPPRFGILLRSVSECSKVFDVTFQLVPNGHEEQFRSSRLYLLDDTQDEAVQIQTNCVIIGRGGSGKTSVLSRKIYTGFMNAIQSEIEILPPRILFVSQSNLLVNSVKVEYSNLITAFFITQPAVKLWEDQPGQVVLLNRNPTFFSFMDLFMEIDRMCGDLSVMFGTTADEDNERRLRLATDRKTSKTSHRFTLSDLVDFERFNRVYYSPANEDLKKRFSAVNVFTEIMSSIKKIDRHGAKRFLSETEYRHLPSDLSVSDKDLIFTFYVRYEANKKSRFHVDMVDAMAHVLSRGSKLDLPKLDFIFVDEVQDLLQCQWSLFDLVRDENTVMVCSGDQAQAITAGNQFKFSTLKGFLFRKNGKEVVERYLTINYRAQKSILDLSNGIISLLEFFFRGEIDKMPNESSGTLSLGSNLPRMFKENEEAALAFLFKESLCFLAGQVILVRTAHEKEMLEIYLKKQGWDALVLTILESKGLEFDDVVLYNVFKPSTTTNLNKYRVLYTFDPPQGLHVPQFNSKIHGDLCHDLKNLYVAVTRARKRLLFIDGSGSNERQVFMYVFRRLIEWTSTSLEGPFCVGDSAKEDWEKEAIAYRNGGLLKEAQQAFFRAGNTVESKRCEAQILIRKLETLSDVKNRQSIAMSAADVLKEIDEFRQAADVLMKVALFKSAGAIYESLDLALLVVDCYSQGNLFDELFAALKKFRLSLDANVVNRQYHECAQYYWNKRTKRAYTCIANIKDDSLALQFLEERSDVKNAEFVSFLMKSYIDRQNFNRGVDFLKRAESSFQLAENLCEMVRHKWAEKSIFKTVYDVKLYRTSKVLRKSLEEPLKLASISSKIEILADLVLKSVSEPKDQAFAKALLVKLHNAAIFEDGVIARVICQLLSDVILFVLEIPDFIHQNLFDNELSRLITFFYSWDSSKSDQCCRMLIRSTFLQTIKTFENLKHIEPPSFEKFIQTLFGNLCDRIATHRVEIEGYCAMFFDEVKSNASTEQEFTSPRTRQASKIMVYNDGVVQQGLFDTLLNCLVAFWVHDVLPCLNTGLSLRPPEKALRLKNMALIVNGIEWLRVLPKRYRNKQVGFYDNSQVLLRAVHLYSSNSFCSYLPTGLVRIGKDIADIGDPTTILQNLTTAGSPFKGIDQIVLLEHLLSIAASCPMNLVKLYRILVQPTIFISFLLGAPSDSKSYSWRVFQAKTSLLAAPKDLRVVIEILTKTFANYPGDFERIYAVVEYMESFLKGKPLAQDSQNTIELIITLLSNVVGWLRNDSIQERLVVILTQELVINARVGGFHEKVNRKIDQILRIVFRQYCNRIKNNQRTGKIQGLIMSYCVNVDTDQDILETIFSQLEEYPSTLFKLYQDMVPLSRVISFLFSARMDSPASVWMFAHGQYLLRMAPRQLDLAIEILSKIFERHPRNEVHAQMVTELVLEFLRGGPAPVRTSPISQRIITMTKMILSDAFKWWGHESYISELTQNLVVEAILCFSLNVSSQQLIFEDVLTEMPDYPLIMFNSYQRISSRSRVISFMFCVQNDSPSHDWRLSRVSEVLLATTNDLDTVVEVLTAVVKCEVAEKSNRLKLVIESLQSFLKDRPSVENITISSRTVNMMNSLLSVVLELGDNGLLERFMADLIQLINLNDNMPKELPPVIQALFVILKQYPREYERVQGLVTFMGSFLKGKTLIRSTSVPAHTIQMMTSILSDLIKWCRQDAQEQLVVGLVQELVAGGRAGRFTRDVNDEIDTVLRDAFFGYCEIFKSSKLVPIIRGMILNFCVIGASNE